MNPTLIKLKERLRNDRECAMAKMAERNAAKKERKKVNRITSKGKEKAVRNCLGKVESSINQPQKNGRRGFNARREPQRSVRKMSIEAEPKAVGHQNRKNERRMEVKCTTKRPYAQSALTRNGNEKKEPPRKKARKSSGELPRGISLLTKCVSKNDEVIDGNIVRNATKREKDKEKKRRQRQRIRQNPELHEMQRRKDHERYIRRKEAGSIKLIGELSVSAVRRKRKAWRENSQRYRLRRALSEDGETGAKDHGNIERQLRDKCKRLEKKLRKKSNQKYREGKKTKQELQKINSRAERYAKRYNRLKQSMKPATPTPVKNFKKVISGRAVSPKIRKKLMFCEVLTNQLRAQAQKCRSYKDKHTFRQVIGRQVLKKYRMLRHVQSFIPKFRNDICNDGSLFTSKRQRSSTAVHRFLVNRVREFMEDDENSFLYPGKRDCITRSKEKKQKRGLKGTLKDLHLQFLKKQTFTMSYTTFCRLKPFWVVQPTAADRDTCLCLKHENVRLMVNKLHQLKVIGENTAHNICASVCCNVDSLECMYDTCNTCKRKEINVPVEEAWDSGTSFQKWQIVGEEREIKGIAKTVKMMKKVTVECKISELVSKLQDELPNFKRHVFNIHHQYQQMKQLRNSLQRSESLIQTHASDEQLDIQTHASDEQLDIQTHASDEQLDLSLESTQRGQWVAAVYSDKWYPGIVEEVDGDFVKVSFMKRRGKKFSWPLKPDIQILPKQKLLCVLQCPPLPTSGQGCFVFENEVVIDNLLKDIM